MVADVTETRSVIPSLEFKTWTTKKSVDTLMFVYLNMFVFGCILFEKEYLLMSLYGKTDWLGFELNYV